MCRAGAQCEERHAAKASANFNESRVGYIVADEPGAVRAVGIVGYANIDHAAIASDAVNAHNLRPIDPEPELSLDRVGEFRYGEVNVLSILHGWVLVGQRANGLCDRRQAVNQPQNGVTPVQPRHPLEVYRARP